MYNSVYVVIRRKNADESKQASIIASNNPSKEREKKHGIIAIGDSRIAAYC